MRELIAVPVDTGTAVHIDTSKISAHTATSLAQAALAAIQRDYLRPDIQEDYQRWKAEREARRKENDLHQKALSHGGGAQVI